MSYVNTRDQALGLVEEGLVSGEDMLIACLKFMSVYDVKAMLESNGWSEQAKEEEEEAEEEVLEEYIYGMDEPIDPMEEHDYRTKLLYV